MDDRFDERLHQRLSALDAAAPTLGANFTIAPSSRRRARMSGRLPMGMAACLAVAVVGLVVVGANWRHVPDAAVKPSPTSGMVVTGAQAELMSDTTLTIAATITNHTDRDDGLVGGSSPIGGTAGLYATCDCWLAPTTGQAGFAGKAPMAFMGIAVEETLQLLPGGGEIILDGATHPLSVGQTVEFTFQFAYAPPVTAEVPIVAALAVP